MGGGGGGAGGGGGGGFGGWYSCVGGGGGGGVGCLSVHLKVSEVQLGTSLLGDGDQRPGDCQVQALNHLRGAVLVPSGQQEACTKERKGNQFNFMGPELNVGLSVPRESGSHRGGQWA